MTRALALALAFLAYTAEARDPRQRAAFVAANPCPATGAPRGPCPGWVVDHVVPLCVGGADAPHNMQWLTVEAAKLKDRDAVRPCRERRARKSG